eukprot:1477283-Rhodomonas_salina.2
MLLGASYRTGQLSPYALPLRGARLPPPHPQVLPARCPLWPYALSAVGRMSVPQQGGSTCWRAVPDCA